MKLTASKKKWIENRIFHYCNLLRCPVPKVMLTMAEYNRWKQQFRDRKNFDEGTRVGRSNILGVCHYPQGDEPGFIVILVKRANNVADLDHVIRHELVHWAKPSYSHGRTFQDRMERLRKGLVNENGIFVSKRKKSC